MIKNYPIIMLFIPLLLVACSKTPDVANSVSLNPPVIAVSGNQLQLPNFVNLVKNVGNTVVNVSAQTNQPSQTQVPDGIDPNDPSFELFKHIMPKEEPKKQELRRSLGSGFIITSDGYILTNAHVVDGARKIIVRTSDKQELEAKLIGLDLKTDIALLKVNAKKLPIVKIGNPDKLEVGEWVAAIGAPFGFDNSVTQGIVSAKGRSLLSDSYVRFIQSDVPINPGNSGGPLFNLNGEVIGINSQIYSRSGGYMGISFSIPIDIAMSIANGLKKDGIVLHGQLGVRVQPVSKEIAKAFGLPKPYGAIVAEAIPGSSAEKSGVKAGDIILKVDNKEVENSTDLPLIIGSKKPGDRVSLSIFRNYQTIVIDAILGGSSDTKASDKKPSNHAKVIQLEKFGLSLADMDLSTRKQMKLNAGVLVTNVSAAATLSGVIPGDVILSINNHLISNVSQVKDTVGTNKTLIILVSRNLQQMFITLSIE